MGSKSTPKIGVRGVENRPPQKVQKIAGGVGVSSDTLGPTDGSGVKNRPRGGVSFLTPSHDAKVDTVVGVTSTRHDAGALLTFAFRARRRSTAAG